MKQRLLLLALLLWPSMAGAVTNRYVSQTGNDLNDGLTPATAWTLVKASNSSLLNAGDTVFFNGGSGYPVAANFGSSPYGCMMAPTRSGVIYRSEHGEWAIIRGGQAFGPFINIMQCNGANNITLDSLEFRWGSKGALLIHGSPSGWTVRNCVFDSCPATGATGDNEGVTQMDVGGDYLESWVFDNCQFYAVRGRGGIHVYGMNNTVVKNCWFHDFIQATDGAQVFIKTGTRGNTNDSIYSNVFDTRSGNVTGVGTLCDATVDYLYIHNNIFIGGNGWQVKTSAEGDCNNSGLDFDSVFVYNNTFDMANGPTGTCILNGRGDNPALVEDINDYYFFNNLHFKPGSAGSIWMKNEDNQHNIALFGDSLYSDYNMFCLRNLTDKVYHFQAAGHVYIDYTAGQWQTASTVYNPTWVGHEQHSVTTTDSLSMFVNRTSANYWSGYGLNAAGSQYSFLSTGGKGGSYPIYIGAINPGVVNPCPNITNVSPPNAAVETVYTVPLLFDVAVDGSANSAIVTLYGNRTTNPPTSVIFVDTLAADSLHWTYNWGTLLEDSTYYYYAKVKDADCSTFTSVRNFTINAVAPPINPPPGGYNIIIGNRVQPGGPQ